MSKDIAKVAALPKINLHHSNAGKPARAPYGLPPVDDCLSCPLRKNHLFCGLPLPVLRRLDAISSVASYPSGAVLFVEGQLSRGVFVICSGRVKLSGGSARGKSLIFRIAEAGEIIGLPGTLSGKPYELTAETLVPTQANFIAHSDFLGFLREHGEAALRVAQMLSRMYDSSCQEMRYLGLAKSAAEKRARFLLDMSAGVTPDKGVVRAQMSLTHEEIGEMIGASRETVTRLFARFKREQFIEVHGASVVISDTRKLQQLIDS